MGRTGPTAKWPPEYYYTGVRPVRQSLTAQRAAEPQERLGLQIHAFYRFAAQRAAEPQERLGLQIHAFYRFAARRAAEPSKMSKLQTQD